MNLTKSAVAITLTLLASPVGAETFEGRWQPRSPGTTVEPSQYGVASIYWEDARTATGERFKPNERDPKKYTCAHPDFPLNTMLIIYRGDRAILCRANDRGPNKRTGRVLDLPPPAAAALGIDRKAGLGKVTVVRAQQGEK